MKPGLNSGLIQDAALANERYAECLLRRDIIHKQKQRPQLYSGGGSSSVDVDDACYRLQQSIQLYREWGASAVVQHLEERYKTVLPTI